MNDGGPAFPYVLTPTNFFPGMSLRYFIATQILGSIVAQHPDKKAVQENVQHEVETAFKYADEMIAQGSI